MSKNEVLTGKEQENESSNITRSLLKATFNYWHHLRRCTSRTAPYGIKSRPERPALNETNKVPIDHSRPPNSIAVWQNRLWWWGWGWRVQFCRQGQQARGLSQMKVKTVIDLFWSDGLESIHIGYLSPAARQATRRNRDTRRLPTFTD